MLWNCLGDIIWGAGAGWKRAKGRLRAREERHCSGEVAAKGEGGAVQQEVAMK